MLATLPARMLTGSMVPTVRMESVWLVGRVLTTLLSYDPSMPVSILAPETLVLTLILHLLVLTRTAAYLTDMF